MYKKRIPKFINFTSSWSKLTDKVLNENNQVFTTIRRDKGIYHTGESVAILNRAHFAFEAKITGIMKLNRSMINEKLAQRDADMSVDDLRSMLTRMYKEHADELILITLKRIVK